MSRAEGPAHSTRARPAPRGGGFRGEPNPLLLRELRQAMRLPRLPWQITAVVVLVGLGMLAVGSTESARGRSAQLGASLFQGFVSVLLGYVALIGPATAAGAIATEREGRTLEPLLLTGLAPKDIARGKFLAAYGSILLQVVALLPLAAIPFLFGGVTALELVVAVVYVMLVAAVSVSFGLAIASRAQTLRAALATSIIVPAAGLPILFALLVATGEAFARKSTLAFSGPAWWATAYATMPFGADYALWLLLWPALGLGLPFWLFQALTASNLASANDDHSTGVKRWYLGATVLLGCAVFLTFLRIEPSAAKGFAVLAFIGTSILLVVMVAVLAAEPIAASRLVRARWERLQTSPFGRAMGPGLLRGAALQVLGGMVLLGLVFFGAVQGGGGGALRNLLGAPMNSAAVGVLGAGLATIVVYILCFDLFLLGILGWMRTAKNPTPSGTARAAVFALAGVALVLPWLLNVIVNHERRPFTFCALSPAFPFYALGETDGVDAEWASLSSLGGGLFWAVLGLVMLGGSFERARRAIGKEEKALAATERKLLREDEEDDDDEENDDAPPPLVEPEPAEAVAAAPVAAPAAPPVAAPAKPEDDEGDQGPPPL
ncbi:MAG: hypothetical protein IPJ34_09245 [Myxococcales bacterium]|nr:hypothetical protein [Myxococcales bacterium]